MLPTDTVYGIGADAFSSTAVQGLLDAKQRGRDMPPPVLLSDAAVLESLAANIDPRVWLLAEAFWPGPHAHRGGPAEPATRPRRERRHDRRPGSRPRGDPRTAAPHGPAGGLERQHQRPPGRSVHRGGHRATGESVSVYLDAGPSGGPVPSTILDMTGTPAVLREGRLTTADLEEAVPGLFPRQPRRAGLTST